jgi:hypothetical protein
MRYLVEVEPVFQPIAAEDDNGAPIRGCYAPPCWPLALCGSERKARRIADGFNLVNGDARALVRPVEAGRRSWAA